MTKETTGRAKRDGRKPAAAEGGNSKFNASDHFEIHTVGEVGDGALITACLLTLGFSREEIRQALRDRAARGAQQDKEGTH